MSFSRLFAPLLALGLMLGGQSAHAAYPDHPVTLVVGFSPGSSIDLVARAVAGKLSERIGEPVIVENRPGAGGNIAAEYTVRAKPNGYTLMVVANNIAIAPAIYSNLKYDTKKDLRAVAYIGVGPMILKVNTQRHDFKTLADLVSYAKAHPGQLNFGSSGVGGSPHMATLLFEKVAGIQMTHVPYKGGGEALTALLGGQVDLLINPLTGDVNTDRVRSLAITGDKRSPMAPSVPTFGEAGYPKFNVGVYYGIMAASGMPTADVDRMNAAVNAVLKDPAIVRALTTQSGIVLKAETPQAFQQFIDRDIATWQQLVSQDKAAFQ